MVSYSSSLSINLRHDQDKDLKEKNKKHTSGFEKSPVDKKPPPVRNIKPQKYPEDFETLWQEYPKRQGTTGKAAAFKA
ncbi:hypothetical protein [Erwinia tracheiphila]|uniref:hypothetical protein n=1 Tax=Erwinia tracheiphila TaxID=65700 RepID=UPI0006972273|nr:hypothetical protein [Erwinia tracheiphila]